MIFAPELARIVGPGFSPEKQARLAHFLRIILPAQVFFLPGACVSALLYIRKQFLGPRAHTAHLQRLHHRGRPP